MKLVPANKQFFEVKWCKRMVEPGQPLRHAIVIGVFCFKGELPVRVKHRSETWKRPKSEAPTGNTAMARIGTDRCPGRLETTMLTLKLSVCGAYHLKPV